MKLIRAYLLVIIISLITITVYSQEPKPDKPDYYEFERDIVVTRFDFIAKKVIDGVKEVANKDWSFADEGPYEVDISGGKKKMRVITFGYFTDAVYNQIYHEDNTKKSNQQQIYFVMDEEDFNNPEIVRKHYQRGWSSWQFVAGTLIVPIKARFSNDKAPFDFANDFTLGLSAGVKFRLSPYRPAYIVPIFSVGITSVSADSATTNGFLKQTNKQSAFTFTLGLLYQYDEFQMGIFMGMDKLSGEVSKNWVYQSKPWFAIGIGYQIFGKKDEKK